MTKLTNKIQLCGIHDCTHNCFAITEKEALAAIEVMREAFIEAVSELQPFSGGFGIITADQAIKAIKSVK